MKTQVRLNTYERGIVHSLVTSFGYEAGPARELVVQYIAVIRKLGGYDTCYDHAERLVQARQLQVTPEAWLERIRNLDREAAKDKGIPHLERNIAYQGLR
ncbi:hypothetical protein BVG16_20055 [Paenibacillus selenitireducens]|jgi:hypothetical protein|uniref:Uncharacterized protein n=1 Tax=Paenibacillus selenitireducens TaxID=1324314 RepID=A0A1T2X6Y3_9BACL|nr:hypothetical protein [Paenibacillus selenitireducens]OPA75634.1 hypothetical protein BVG16_20055 [Paenibacillus selenitireducens]